MAGGGSLLMLAFFHWLTAVRQWTAPAFFFVVIGMNAILIYLAVDGGLVAFSATAKALFGGAINGSTGVQAWRDVLMTCGSLSLEWGFLWFLWRQKVFVRI
jgi:hypothetical protein